MTRIKFCGLAAKEDIAAANLLRPDYIGFVFWKKSKRSIDEKCAKELRGLLNQDIKAVGVFVDEDISFVTELLNEGIIDLAQLHGNESESYIRRLKDLSGSPVIKAFLIKSEEDIKKANASSADYVLLDAGLGGGTGFDWQLAKKAEKPYFLAGGLSAQNVSEAVQRLHPFAVDVSSGIETDERKDAFKMESFAAEVRAADRYLEGAEK